MVLLLSLFLLLSYVPIFLRLESIREVMELLPVEFGVSQGRVSTLSYVLPLLCSEHSAMIEVNQRGGVPISIK